MIYYMEDIDQFTSEMNNQYLNLLPLERQQKVHRYRRVIDQKLSIISYLLLLYGLRQEYGITESVRWMHDHNQKPYLIDYPHIHFNISHCECCAAVAISNREIGIDVQNVTTYDAALASSVCSTSELEQLSQSTQPDMLFIQYWALKESYLKKIGTGITKGMKHLDFSAASTLAFSQYDCHFHLLQRSHYYLSICSTHSSLPIHRVSPAEFHQYFS